MAKQVKEHNILIATRIKGKGDTWKLINDNPEGKIYNSLTNTLEAYFQKVKEPCEFRLAPLKGELYVITTKEVQVKTTLPKRPNIYGDS